MPRCARVKFSTGIYHVMIKSCSEILLFKENSDKEKYLQLIKKYQKVFCFKVYSYCLMTNHGHILINCNGADISKFMHRINQCFAIYYNKKYNRCGHVFHDRFKSKLVSPTNTSLLNLSTYIHNNPKDINHYKNKVEKYPYSSLSIILGTKKNLYDILDVNFILNIIGSNIEKSRVQYYNYVKMRLGTPSSKDFNSEYWDNTENITQDYEFEKNNYEYRSEKKAIVSKISPNEVVNFISKYTNMNKNMINIKFNKSAIEFKSLFIVIMSSLCNFTHKMLCSFIGNITSSNVSNLYNKGCTMINTCPKYQNIISDFISTYALSVC